jgi:aryl-alcohol dehydrogenase-like predicted oxidoreductase
VSNKLILGTAQFGSDYGIKHDGQPSEKEIEKIARVAWDGGIRTIHTSWQYNLPKICDAIFEGFEKIEKDWISSYFHFKNKMGQCVYDPNEVDLYLIQAPVNILDKRFLNLKRDHIIHARSVFLQGLLLMDDIPKWISPVANMAINLFHLQCKAHGLQYYEAALGYVLGLDEIDHVIIGVNNAKQLEQVLQVKPLKWDYDFSITDENILDPRKWPKT